MSSFSEPWFWLLEIGVVLLFAGLVLWGSRRRLEWWNWLFMIGGLIFLIIAIFMISRLRKRHPHPRPTQTQ